MIATPLRWLLMAGVAACGCAMIASNDMNARAFAFVISIVLWQAHYVLMMYEADLLRSAGMKSKEAKNAVEAGKKEPV